MKLLPADQTKRLNRRISSCTLLFLSFTLLLLCGCGQRPSSDLLKKEWVGPFDTLSQLLADGTSEEDFERACKLMSEDLERYDSLFNAYADPEKSPIDSLAAFNSKAGEGPQPIAPELMELLLYSRKIAEESQGAFNPLLGPITRRWHRFREEVEKDASSAELPGRRELETLSDNCHPEDFIIYPERGEAELKLKGMSLDLGAIAKGFSEEKIARHLQEEGYEHLLISMGGSVCALGPKADGSAWMIGIQNPKGKDEPYLELLPLYAGAVSTSGTYERYVLFEGKRYHHIIDPQSLYPSASYDSVSVVAADAALADALSTALFNLFPEEGERLAEENQVAVLYLRSESGELLRNRAWETALKEGFSFN